VIAYSVIPVSGIRFTFSVLLSCSSTFTLRNKSWNAGFNHWIQPLCGRVMGSGSTSGMLFGIGHTLVSASPKAGFASLLEGAAWLLFVAAALALWVGGRAIKEFAGTERITAEAEGVGLAMLFD
jgi:hypothetical protein